MIKIGGKLLGILVILAVLWGAISGALLPGKALGADTDYFTVAVLPDTQHYSASYPSIFDQQTQWIVNNAQAQNIVFVCHLGDIVDDYNVTAEWENAHHSMGIIRDAGIPYSVVPGNHDLNGPAGDTSFFESYFPDTDFSGYSWYGGNYPSNSNSNNYELISAMQQDFVILNLVCTPPLLSDAIGWANGILTQYSDRKAIVITHGYIDAQGKYSDIYDTSGIEIWNNIVKIHSNVIAVFCGHTCPQLYNWDTGSGGNRVYNLLTDYQNLPNGGNGYLRLYKFYPRLNKISAFTYSPSLNLYDNSTGSKGGRFDMPLEMESGITALSVSPASGMYNETVDLSATLTSSGSPLSGKTVNFAINGTDVGNATTNSGGVAILTGVSLAGISVGTHTGYIVASFAGDADNSASSGTADLTVNGASVSKIVFTNPAQTLTAGSVSRIITIQTQDTYGNPTNMGTNTVINLSSSSVNGAFYSDSRGTRRITSVTIRSGTSSASFYYKDTQAGTPTITIDKPGLTGANQQETINAASISKIVFTTPAQTIKAGAVSGVMTIQTLDSYGNPASVKNNTIINLSSSSMNDRFYSNAGGTQRITSVTISSGANSASFYYKDTRVGTPTITAAKSGWYSATQREKITQ